MASAQINACRTSGVITHASGANVAEISLRATSDIAGVTKVAKMGVDTETSELSQTLTQKQLGPLPNIDRSGILSNDGAVQAMCCAATGSAPYKEPADQRLLYAVHASHRGGWREDAHRNKIHNQLDAIGAFPEGGR